MHYTTKNESRQIFSYNVRKNENNIFNTTHRGAALCKKLKDGCYSLPFLIFREHIKDGSNLSMANEGFEHPCSLYVKGGSCTKTIWNPTSKGRA